MDTSTGEADAGKRIKAMRAELSKDKLASFFSSELELAGLVNAAVINLESAKSSTGTGRASRSGPENRQIASDLFITFATADKPLASKLAEEFVPDLRGISSLLAEGDLFAAKEDALLKLDLRLQTCDVAVAVLSKRALVQMEEQRKNVELALDMMRSRSGALIALCADVESVNSAPGWHFTERIDVSGYPAAGIALIGQVKKQLAVHCTVANYPIIGVPLVIAAMNEEGPGSSATIPTSSSTRWAATRSRNLSSFAPRCRSLFGCATGPPASNGDLLDRNLP